MKKGSKEHELTKKSEYIGLNLEQIPETLKIVEDLKFKPSIGFDEKKYRQYRYVSPKEIEILLSPTNRLEDVKEKYEKMIYFCEKYKMPYMVIDTSNLSPEDVVEVIMKRIEGRE